MLRACAGRRRTSRPPQLVDLFAAAPLVTGASVARVFEITPQAVEAMMAKLGPAAGIDGAAAVSGVRSAWDSAPSTAVESQVAIEIHSLMQDAHDLDHLTIASSIEGHVRTNHELVVAGADVRGAAALHYAAREAVQAIRNQPNVAVSLRLVPALDE